MHFLVIPKDKKGLNRLSSATEEHIPLLGVLHTLTKISYIHAYMYQVYSCILTVHIYNTFTQ